MQVPPKFRLKTQVWWVVDVGGARCSLHLLRNVPILFTYKWKFIVQDCTRTPPPRPTWLIPQSWRLTSSPTIWLPQATGKCTRNTLVCSRRLLPRGLQGHWWPLMHAPPNPGSLCLSQLLFRELSRKPASFSPGSRGSWRPMGTPRNEHFNGI